MSLKTIGCCLSVSRPFLRYCCDTENTKFCSHSVRERKFLSNLIKVGSVCLVSSFKKRKSFLSRSICILIDSTEPLLKFGWVFKNLLMVAVFNGEPKPWKITWKHSEPRSRVMFSPRNSKIVVRPVFPHAPQVPSKTVETRRSFIFPSEETICAIAS